MENDRIQHGIDDNPTGDAEKGAALGGLGGAAVGAAAGSLAGPLGAVVGAVAGGLIGAGASGAAVAAIDEVDNDNTVSGLGDGASYVGDERENIRPSTDESVVDVGVGGHNVVTGAPASSEAGTTGLAAGAVAGGLIGTVVGGPVGAVVGGTLGSLAGGVAGDAAEASSEAPSAAYTGDVNYPGSALVERPDIVDDVTSLPADNTRVNDDVYGRNDNLRVNDDVISGRDATRASDDVLAPSTQTDYRNVDSGVTSLGGTDQNADVSTLTGEGTPGVRSEHDSDPIINWSGAHGETLNESKQIEKEQTGGGSSAPEKPVY